MGSNLDSRCRRRSFLLVARHLADPTTSWIATIMVAFGSTMWTTVGQSLWQHGGLVFWSLLFLLIEFHSARRRSSASAFGQGFCWAMMLSCRLSAAIMIVPLAIWILLRDPKRTLVIATWAILAYLPWVWAYGSVYGNLLGLRYTSLTAPIGEPALTVSGGF